MKAWLKEALIIALGAALGRYAIDYVVDVRDTARMQQQSEQLKQDVAVTISDQRSQFISWCMDASQEEKQKFVEDVMVSYRTEYYKRLDGPQDQRLMAPDTVENTFLRYTTQPANTHQCEMLSSIAGGAWK